MSVALPPPPPDDPNTEAGIMLILLDECRPGEVVSVIIDARLPGVELPAFLKTGGQKLDYSYDFKSPPIPDLFVDATGIRATLSLNGGPHKTFIPWSAVGCVQVPATVSMRAAARLGIAMGGGSSPSVPALRVIGADEAPPTDASAPERRPFVPVVVQ
jgi:hypothetical protein